MQKDTVALNSDTLKEGDVVQLKSGGPKMTVQAIGSKIYGSDSVLCVWFDHNAKCGESFPLQALILC